MGHTCQLEIRDQELALCGRELRQRRPQAATGKPEVVEGCLRRCGPGGAEHADAQCHQLLVDAPGLNQVTRLHGREQVAKAVADDVTDDADEPDEADGQRGQVEQVLARVVVELAATQDVRRGSEVTGRVLDGDDALVLTGGDQRVR